MNGSHCRLVAYKFAALPSLATEVPSMEADVLALDAAECDCGLSLQGPRDGIAA